MRDPSGDHTGCRSANPGGAGQVPPRALVGGHAEEFAPATRRSRACRWGERRASRRPPAGTASHLARDQFHVAGHVDDELPRGAGGRVELMQVAGLLVNDHPVARAERLHVEVGVLRELTLGAGTRIEGPHVAGPVPVSDM